MVRFMESGSLLHTLKSFGALDEQRTRLYVYQILDGLAYLHLQNIVHCDLKAANLLCGKYGTVKLSDFGVSLNLKIRSEDIGAMVAGTPNWMAPEVIELKGACTQSDLWSLGCTIIEMLTRKPPYDGIATQMTVLFKIVEDEHPPLPPNISEVNLNARAYNFSFRICVIFF